jgi:hypothetical protein
LSTGAAYTRSSGVPTGKHPEDSNLDWSVEVMQQVFLYLPIAGVRTSHTAWLKCAGTPSCMYSILSAVTQLHFPGHVLILTLPLVLVCGTHAQSLSSPFSYTCIAVKIQVKMEEWGMMLSRK